MTTFLKKLKIKFPRDTAIPPLGTHTEELKVGSQRDICALVFTAALFTIAKLRGGSNPSVRRQRNG